MNGLDSVLSSGYAGVVEQLASQFGISADQAGSAVSALLPAIAGGIKAKLASDGGAALSNVISSGRLCNFADDPASLATAGALTQGNSMLNKIYGGADLAKMACTIAQDAGISSNMMVYMLPIVTALLGGLLYKSTADGQNELTDIVGAVASGGQSRVLDAITGVAWNVVG